ncbi:MAG: DUF1549 domain-containing protein, partial [Verrucomicrobiae bacterium]|nr:DUF1549 domain-containing protein [Verrucomicrobiae bacterium]
DRFVLGRLEREKLAPSPEADGAEWLRRVSFDLTGLPPAETDLADLESAADPEAARAAVVDRLLATPAFGERWAAMWLDLARYSDTTGFEKDPHREIWPYRDWVVRAFNADMPYDRFTIEQLAGDLLPNPTAELRLATAFHRNTQTNTEGGTDDEEYRVAAVTDRINTTWTAWQATTFGCVQCHAHPYDPFPHDDYYRFMAFFDGTEDCDQDDDFPKMRWANDAAKRDEATRLELRIRELRAALNAPGAALIQQGSWSALGIDGFAPTHGKLVASADGTVRAEGTLPVGCTHVVSAPAADFRALRLGVLPESDNPKDWPERGSLVTEWKVALVAADGTRTDIPFSAVFSEKMSGPREPNPGGNLGEFPKLNGPVSFVLVATQPVTAPPDARIEVSMKQGASTTGNQATSLRRFRIDRSNDPVWTELASSPDRAALAKELREARGKLNAIPGTHVPVMMERFPAAIRETRVFARGNRLSKEHVVKPGLPELLTDGDGQFADRLAMARWLVDGENPLTARVMANRLWSELFGIGIVETNEDFGTSGTLPSDQALLDFLALRFQNEHRWSVKSLLREIVLSATYRQ